MSSIETFHSLEEDFVPNTSETVKTIQPGTLRVSVNRLIGRIKKFWVALVAAFSFLGVAGAVLAFVVTAADGTNTVASVAKVPEQIQDMITQYEGRLKSDEAATAYNTAVKEFIYKLDNRLYSAGATVDEIIDLYGDTPKQAHAVAARQNGTAKLLFTRSENEAREWAEKTVYAMDTLAGCVNMKCHREQLIVNAGYTFCANNRTLRSWIVQNRKRNPDFGRIFTDLVDTIDCKPILYGAKASS